MRRILTALGVFAFTIACGSSDDPLGPKIDDPNPGSKRTDLDCSSGKCACADGHCQSRCDNSFPNCSMDCGGGDCFVHCPDKGNCTMTCGGGKCMTYCGVGICQVNCSGGGCNTSCPAGATCGMSCSGGNCYMACAKSSICSVDCSGGNCKLDCPQGATCSITNCSTTNKCACTGDGCP